MTIRTIGISGSARSGKDTAARYLVQSLNTNENWFKSSFADPIRTMLASVGITVEDDTKDNEVYLGKTKRYFMQSLGTDWGRNLISQDLWIELLFNQFEESDKIIIPDVRFANEAEAIRSRNGIIIHVTGRAGDYAATRSHESEQFRNVYKESDIILDNSGSLIDLENSLNNIINLIKKG